MEMNECFNCNSKLEDSKVTVGAYGIRGSYCDVLCAYLRQPGWVKKERVVDNLKQRLSESSNRNQKFFFHIEKNRDIDALKSVFNQLKCRIIRLDRVDVNLLLIEVTHKS